MNNEKIVKDTVVEEALASESTKKSFKDKLNEIKNDFKDPIKKKIIARKSLGFGGALFRTLILIGLCFVILFPIFSRLSFGFRHPIDLSNPLVVWIPETWSTINFQIAAKLLSFWESFTNTLILSTVVMIINIIVCSFFGYAFARLKFKGSKILFALVLISLVVPNETLLQSRTLFFMDNRFFGINIMNSAIAIVIMTLFGSGIRSAIFIYLFRQAFRSLPMELEESAQVDGAGVVRTFWSVMLPNARGTIVTVGLFAFVWQWNDYYFGRLFNIEAKSGTFLAVTLAKGTENLFTKISTWVAAGDPFFKSMTSESINKNALFIGMVANTAALLLMLPLMIGYLFVQKLFVESIERTGIVG